MFLDALAERKDTRVFHFLAALWRKLLRQKSSGSFLRQFVSSLIFLTGTKQKVASSVAVGF